MKQVLMLCCLLATGTALWAQDEQASLPPTLRQLTLDQKAWMTSEGFPIAKYDYSRPDINLELSTALKQQKNGKTLTNVSWVALGVGALFLFLPKDPSSSRANTTIVSTAMMLGGLSLNLVGWSKRRDAQKRLQNASYLYYEK